MSSELTRRRLVELGVLGGAGVLAGCNPASDEPRDPEPDTDPPACPRTNTDIEGPFYVSDAPVRADLDTWDDPGLKIALSGVLTDQDCTPLAGAVIEIWQADDEGGYDNESADMRYRGQQATDAQGRYAFTTIMPGRYLNGAEYRPAHIHVKIWVDGVERLTTQLYFEGDPYNDIDAWFDPARAMAIDDHGDGTASCTYDFAL